jgi:hypothetical protein
MPELITAQVFQFMSGPMTKIQGTGRTGFKGIPPSDYMLQMQGGAPVDYLVHAR